MAAGISANARSQVIFTASPEDARALERHTLPNLGAHDLAHLGAYQATARLVTGGGETPAFTFHTLWGSITRSGLAWAVLRVGNIAE